MAFNNPVNTKVPPAKTEKQYAPVVYTFSGIWMHSRLF